MKLNDLELFIKACKVLNIVPTWEQVKKYHAKIKAEHGAII